MNNKQFKLNTQPFDLYKAISRAQEIVHFHAARKHINILQIFNGSEQDKKLLKCLNGDKNRLIQVLTNLISNSVKFSHNDSEIHIVVSVRDKKKSFDDHYKKIKSAPDSSVQCKVSNNAQSEYFGLRSEDWASQNKDKRQFEESRVTFEIKVRDFGSGMSTDQANNIFQRFGNIGAQTTQNPTGRGIGLSICKLIVQEMKGNLSVSSRLDHGTEFSILLSLKSVKLNES